MKTKSLRWAVRFSVLRLLAQLAITVTLVVAAIGITTADTFAQRNPAFYDYPQNHLDWYTIESDHFFVHFQEGNSRPAQVISRIAEEVYDPITELYDHEPDHKISILLIDRLDYSNGAAFFYDNKIEIWLPALDSPLRGTHNWLRNVITHEFTHIVQLQASMKRSRRHPATYLQWLSYEDVRRPDVLYGFPKGIISYPFSGISMPAWMAEGTAQYMHQEIYYDDWDSHRDMLLRTRILDRSYLSLQQMGTFSSKTSLERELTYNQGFAFIRYMAGHFGEEAIVDITRAFSHSGIHDARKAIQIGTGVDGQVVFDDWIAHLTDQYTRFANERVRDPENRTWIEPSGFFNFYPTFDPQGRQIAYLSNKNSDGAALTLYLKDIERDEDYTLENPLPSSILQRPETSFSFAPDGKRIVYSRARINKYGEQYRDLYILDLQSQKSKKLTDSQRLQDPAWSPGGKMIAAGKIEDGSVNLYLYHLETEELIRVTDFKGGEQVYRPVWHPDGKSIYLAYADISHRGIFHVTLSDDKSIENLSADDHITTVKVNRHTVTPGNSDSSPIDGSGHPENSTLPNGDHFRLKPILMDPIIDYRDAAVSSDGQWLYYSADIDGVFDIYRMSLQTGYIEQVTRTVGGAFMPSPHPSNDHLLYSEFVSDGYKIALLDLTETEFPIIHRQATGDPDLLLSNKNPDSTMTLLPPRIKPSVDPAPPGSIRSLNHFDDSDIASLTPEAKAVADTGIYRYSIPVRGSPAGRQVYSYEDQFTSFQFYPVIRFDNYSHLRGSNRTLISQGSIAALGRNLWRDVKIGTYFASREMRDQFTIFGGALFGPGSRSSNGLSNFFNPGRLVNLDRDLFLEVEYAGLPFIERHWSPTVSLAFFNIHRNVREGLQIEEFSCSACLPDTTSIDIAYDMWQVEVNLVSKMNRWSLVELGYSYSPYRVSTTSFFSREFQQEIPGSTSRYFVGSTWTSAYIFNLASPDRHGDIAPIGLRGLVRYKFEPSELLDSYDIRNGTLVPVYNEFNNHSFELDMGWGFDIRNLRFRLRSRFFSYLDSPDEFFYLDYIGGMTGMRSYPYFALGGSTTAFSQFSWFIPLKTDIYRQMGRITLDKIFLRLFSEAGNGWGGPLGIDKNIKTGVGAELRIGMNSYYLFPTSFFISGAYGFNAYDLQLPDAFITETPSGRVSYGNQVMFHFGLLFDFDF
ncbi:MAG: hypothetical protein WD097_09045 [Balneolales bacterium]